MTAPDFAGVLRKHLWHDRKGQTCGCGWDYERGNGVPRVEQYCAHVAAALDAEMVAWLGSEAVGDAVRFALHDQWAKSGGEPDICTDDYADFALAALAQAADAPTNPGPGLELRPDAPSPPSGPGRERRRS